ncbi:MAG: ATP-binding cassette domain-containing protein [Lachnospirales bacterium]
MKNLEFKHVSFSYGEKKVWEDLNLCFEAGKKSIVMGPSGIGKTTLFRLALGLILPDQGQILGIPGDGAGVLFQEDRLFPHLSVLENLKVCVPERTEEELLKMLFRLGLSGEENRYPAELSGGMRRRVACIRAVAVRRELYLLDEPFNGLDERLKDRAASWILEETKGKTLIVITHQIRDAEMLGGKILQF